MTETLHHAVVEHSNKSTLQYLSELCNQSDM